MREQEFTQEEREIAEQGLAAKALKDNPVFQFYLNGMSMQHQVELFHSEPHESKKREMLYHFVTALQGMVHAIDNDIRQLELLEETLNSEVEDV